MTAITITGPDLHPLRTRLREVQRLDDAARRILEQHHDLGESDQSVFRRHGGSDGYWGYLGPREDYAHLEDGRSHITVNGRGPHAHQRVLDTITYAAWGHGAAELGGLARAAARATPMVAVLLAAGLYRGAITWDTGETVTAAAQRLSCDTAWHLLGRSAHPSPADIWTGVAAACGASATSPTTLAAQYLAQRDDIDATLAQQGLDWGERLLDALTAASHAEVKAPTWRAYAARHEVPTQDRADPPSWPNPSWPNLRPPGAQRGPSDTQPHSSDRGWRRSTVDAWRLTRTRSDQAWWNTPL